MELSIQLRVARDCTDTTDVIPQSGISRRQLAKCFLRWPIRVPDAARVVLGRFHGVWNNIFHDQTCIARTHEVGVVFFLTQDDYIWRLRKGEMMSDSPYDGCLGSPQVDESRVWEILTVDCLM